MDDTWNPIAWDHMVTQLGRRIIEALCVCSQCGHALPRPTAKYCDECGYELGDEVSNKVDRLFQILSGDLHIDGAVMEQLIKKYDQVLQNFAFPSQGIYIYYHEVEKYKIGKAENVPRRIAKHECTAPSLRLLHVIETSDLDWCERFLHNKFRHCRIHANHEYFDLSEKEKEWLFAIKVLEPPRSIGDQLSLLELL